MILNALIRVDYQNCLSMIFAPDSNISAFFHSALVIYLIIICTVSLYSNADMLAELLLLRGYDDEHGGSKKICILNWEEK